MCFWTLKMILCPLPHIKYQDIVCSLLNLLLATQKPHNATIFSPNIQHSSSIFQTQCFGWLEFWTFWGHRWAVLTQISCSGVGWCKPSLERVGVWQRVRRTDSPLSPLEARHPHVQQVPHSHPGRFAILPFFNEPKPYTQVPQRTLRPLQTHSLELLRPRERIIELLVVNSCCQLSPAALCLSFGVT